MFQPPVPVGDEKGEQVVSPQQGQAQEDFAGGPERGFADIALVAAFPPHQEQDDQNHTEGGLETHHGIHRRQDGVFPARHHTHGVVGDKDELDENQQHKVPRAEEGQAGLLGVPLLFSSVPAAGNQPVESPPPAGGGQAGLGQIGPGREVQQSQAAYRQADQAQKVPQMGAADGDFEPQGAAHFQIRRPGQAALGGVAQGPLLAQGIVAANARRLRIVDGRHCQHQGDEQEDVDHADHGEQFGDPGDRPPPVAFGKAESAGGQGGGPRYHKDKGKDAHIVAPGAGLGKAAAAQLDNKAEHAQDGQDAGRRQGQFIARGQGGGLGGDIRRHLLGLGKDPHTGVMAVAAAVILDAAVSHCFRPSRGSGRPFSGKSGWAWCGVPRGADSPGFCGHVRGGCRTC